MKIYSALFDNFYPFVSWYPDAEFVLLRVGMRPWTNDGFLILHGGNDIDNRIYGRELEPSSSKIGLRDREEVEMSRKAIQLGLPILGICRGAQLLCALAGGILVQHVNGHAGPDHPIQTIDGKTLFTNSVHHQMCFPWNIEHKLIAWAAPSISKLYFGISEEENKLMLKEPEVIYFPTVKGLGIQGHPEFLRIDDSFNKYCKELTDEYIIRAF